MFNVHHSFRCCLLSLITKNLGYAKEVQTAVLQVAVPNQTGNVVEMENLALLYQKTAFHQIHHCFQRLMPKRRQISFFTYLEQIEKNELKTFRSPQIMF